MNFGSVIYVNRNVELLNCNWLLAMESSYLLLINEGCLRSFNSPGYNVAFCLQLERLDSDLKNYRSNSIRESIRRGFDALGDHYLDCGELKCVHF